MKRLSPALSLPLVAALLLFGTAPAAVASSGPRWTPEQLTDFSAAVVTGRVASLATATDATGRIYTYVTIDVTEVLKGFESIPGAQIVLKQAGGIVGDIGMSVSGQATFNLGEEVLVFADVRPRDRTLATTALWQGKWAIEYDAATGARVAVQNDDSIRNGSTEMARLEFGSIRDSIARRAAQDRRTQPFDAAPSETPASGEGSPFTLFSNPAKWRTLPARLDVQAGGQPGLAGGGLNQLANVISQWNAPSNFKWAVGSLNGTVRSGTAQPPSIANNWLMIEANDPFEEIPDTGGTLAVAFSWFTTAVEETFNGMGFRRIFQVTVITNNSGTAQQFVTNSNCYNQVMLHEVGHALGLGHSTVSTAVMAPTVAFSQCAAAPRPLQPDDIAGVQFIYGAGGPAPGQPVITSASAAGGVLTVQWTSGAGGPPTAHGLEFYSGTTLVAAANVGPATTFQTPVPPGVQGAFAVRVRAGNAGGISPFSAPFPFTIGGGAPGQPTVTAATESGGILTVSWASGTGASPSAHRLAFFQGATQVASVNASGATSIGIPIPAGVQGSFAVVVTAFNGSLASPPSAPFNFTLGPVCTVPTAPAVTGGVAGGTATASWPAVPGATRYIVSAGTAPGGTQFLAPTNVTGTVVSASGLPAGFQAWVRVVAVNACGQAGPATDFLVQ